MLSRAAALYQNACFCLSVSVACASSAALAAADSAISRVARFFLRQRSVSRKPFSAASVASTSSVARSSSARFLLLLLYSSSTRIIALQMSCNLGSRILFRFALRARHCGHSLQKNKQPPNNVYHVVRRLCSLAALNGVPKPPEALVGSSVWFDMLVCAAQFNSNFNFDRSWFYFGIWPNHLLDLGMVIFFYFDFSSPPRPNLPIWA